ncbi:phosphoribosyl-ATP pyrophosphohydrolase [Paenibacillus yanchengensis]|uniref:Phosphoribosyl-ATP pyrophosphohydrolase n=1 Tax=Paenibacillus yanchengensis TaxID=2035833 RepID=A0ABW4YK78_9BACL
MKIYNKLVRDKIPQIVETNGQQCDISFLNEEEYEVALKLKLQEELNEFLQAKNVNEQMEELSDLLEIIYSIAESKGVVREELENIRQRKREERGGFQKRIMLLTSS